MIFTKLFLPRYPGSVQWELDLRRKSRLTFPSVCLLLHGHLVSCFPYSLASEICLFSLDHGEKEGCQRGNGSLSSFCWAPHVCNVSWCRAEGQPEPRKLQMLWVQEELTQSGPLLCGAFKHADSLTLHDEKRGKRQRWQIWHKHTREAPGTGSKLGMCVGPACWARKKSGSRIPGSGPCRDERGEGMPVLGVSER